MTTPTFPAPPDYTTYSKSQLQTAQASLQSYLAAATYKPALLNLFPRLDASCYSSWLSPLNRESILLKKQLYHQKNKDSLNQQKNTYRNLHPEVSRKSKLKSKYGLTLTQFNSLLQSSANRCPICLEPFSSRGLRRPVVDHCHNSNTVRGLLCMARNTG